MAAVVSDERVRAFRDRMFCLREGTAPALARASGDSGFVAHLAVSTHGATGWDWSFRLVRQGVGWSFVSDGKLTLFLDEPGQFVPHDAKPGDQVAVRLPRARENLFPHRFTLHGGQGGPVLPHGYAKLFVPVTYEAAPALVEAFASRWADQLRFGLHVANASVDFERADSAIVDVGPQDEAGVIKLLDMFLRQHPEAIRKRGRPYGTVEGPLGLPRASGQGRTDLADGFGWRKSTEAVTSGGAR
ncbi:MAG: hypothetical protein MUC96_14545 [Myxococcaceae bacterium]|jgi:hypothetical protein|nr:hypothetical protein [Myxococcaceae bacterium]